MNDVILEQNWWGKYQLKDFPASWMNPHFEYIWNHAPYDRKEIGKMAIGIVREPSLKRKIAMFNVLKNELMRYDVYIPLTARELLSGSQKAIKILASAVMEVFSHTGMYGSGELEDGEHVWKYVKDE